MNWINFKEYFKNSSLILGGIIFALMAGEIFLRLTFVNPIVNHPVLGNMGRPGQGYDDNGFRNDQVVATADLVAIGDSQTYGNNASIASDAWPQVLGRLLNKTVYQLAFGGYSPAQYDYLVETAIKLKPKTVLIGFYLGNDLSEAYYSVYNLNNDQWSFLRDQSILEAQGRVVAQGSSDIRLMLQTGYNQDSLSLKVYRLRRYLRNHLRIYAYLGNASRNWREFVGLAKDKERMRNDIADWAEKNPQAALVYKTSNYAGIISPAYRLDSVDLSNSQTAEGWRLSQYFFKNIQKQLAEIGTNLVIVKIPTKEAVLGSVLQERDGSVHPDLANFLNKEAELSTVFMDFCHAEQLNCLDVLPNLRSALTAGQIIYPATMDGHPVPEGYAVIAQAIEAFLRELKQF